MLTNLLAKRSLTKRTSATSSRFSCEFRHLQLVCFNFISLFSASFLTENSFFFECFQTDVMSRDYRYFQRTFDPLSRDWELQNLLEIRHGPLAISQSLISIVGEQKPRLIQTSWLTDDEIYNFRLKVPPPKVNCATHVLQTFHLLSTATSPSSTPLSEDFTLFCDQQGIYFKPTKVESQNSVIDSSTPKSTLNFTHSTQQTVPSPTLSTPSPCEASKLDQPGISKPKPVLSPTNGDSTQHTQQPQQPTLTDSKSSKFLNPTKISASHRPPPLQIPSTPKSTIPLLSPRPHSPPLPFPVILFLLLNLLTQVPPNLFPPHSPSPPSTSPRFPRHVVCM